MGREARINRERKLKLLAEGKLDAPPRILDKIRPNPSRKLIEVLTMAHMLAMPDYRRKR